MNDLALTHEYDDVAQYLSKPYARVVIPEADGSFRGEMLEFPGCIADGETASEAITNLEDAAKWWIVSALEQGQRIPAPVEDINGFSGRLALRLPKSLHKKAAFYAEREGVSLNQFIVYSVSETVGERRPSRYMFVNIIPMHTAIGTATGFNQTVAIGQASAMVITQGPYMATNVVQHHAGR